MSGVDKFAIAQTRGGAVRGRAVGNVFSFLGVRYGEDTAKHRFRRATPVQPWSGLRDALAFPPQCLQPPSPDFELLRSGWDQALASSEDCLHLNLWTPGLDDARRPVMVNLHGGGWTVGNGNSAGRSGETFAHHHDVVRVNVNHRLGVFGFSHVVDLLGPEFADAGTVGILDVVLALEWVRDNIAAFGGDPNNVTIFGVSGGGQKVSTLMAMPAAKGLFHRASVESGPMLTARLPASAGEAATALLETLGIEPERASDLLALSGDEIMAGYMKMYPDGGLLASGISPVVDGVNLPRHPFEPTAPDVSDHVPLLIGTTATETSIFADFLGGDPFGIGWNELERRLTELLPPVPPPATIIERARQAMPDASPTTLLFAITTELMFRTRAIAQAERASRRPAAVYMWLLEWNTAADGGKWGSPHGLSVPLVMDTVQSVPSMFGDDLEGAMIMSRTMSGVWAAFARTGVPALPGLAEWPPYDEHDRRTMVFDTDSRAVSDPKSAFRTLFRP